MESKTNTILYLKKKSDNQLPSFADYYFKLFNELVLIQMRFEWYKLPARAIPAD